MLACMALTKCGMVQQCPHVWWADTSLVFVVCAATLPSRLCVLPLRLSWVGATAGSSMTMWHVTSWRACQVRRGLQMALPALATCDGLLLPPFCVLGWGRIYD
jgi:hypothetical protein